jgi:nucleoside-diphosphate-sugar epimerase
MNLPLRGRKIALVGGAGFIGHHLALELARRGAHVDVIDGLQVNNLNAFAASPAGSESRQLYLQFLYERLDLLRDAGVALHVLDARDYHLLTRTLAKIEPEVIVHLAAVSHAGRSNKDPYDTFDHSLRTLENALDFARGRVEHFVFFSSSMAYGNFNGESIDEEHPLNPMGIYGALKVAGEKIVIAYNQVFDLPYTIIRPSALYGPRCVSRRVGQVFIENALNGRPLRIEGDGREKLDFTYVDDLVDGVCRVVQRPEARNEIFNMTHGDARPILDLVDILRREVPGLDVEFIPRDHLTPVRGTLSIDKARELIGYAPSHPLEVGYRLYLDWYYSCLRHEALGKAA